MKALLPILASIAVVAGAAPALANQGVSQSALATATRNVVPVAPWISLNIVKVSPGAELAWVARSSGGQVYVCSAGEASSLDRVACIRAGAVVAPWRANAEANLNLAKSRRMEVTLFEPQINQAGISLPVRLTTNAVNGY